MNQSALLVSLQDALQSLTVPDFGGMPLAQVASIAEHKVQQGQLTLVVTTEIPMAGLQAGLSEQLWEAIKGLDGLEGLSVEWQLAVPEAPVLDASKAVNGVRNIIAVASGKGGVGKSTTAVNLALALVAEGAKVGILDADIYGPSVPAMLGVSEVRPEVVDNKFMRPVETHGLYAISMGMLVTEQTPMAWRGPMASGALQQLLRQTHWPDVDYLLIDMPPGTGDIQLTLSQTVPVSGAVIVSTPQDIALLDARKGIEMFRKVNVPVLGVVENMSLHVCSQCGHQEAIFGAGGGQRIAADYQTELLGQLPLSLSVREQADCGTPVVVADGGGDVAQIYRSIARKVACRQLEMSRELQMPTIEIDDE